jgi:hypothetical protein
LTSTTDLIVKSMAVAMVEKDSGPNGSTLFGVHWNEFGATYTESAEAAWKAAQKLLVKRIDDRIAELDKADTAWLSASAGIAELRAFRDCIVGAPVPDAPALRVCSKCKTPEGEPHPYRHVPHYE